MNINWHANFRDYEKEIVDAYVALYGEECFGIKVRPIIEKRIKNVNVYAFLNPTTISDYIEVCNKELLSLDHKLGKLNKKSKAFETTLEKYTKLYREATQLVNYNNAHVDLLEYLCRKHINPFIERFKYLLTEDDRKIWNETHDANQLQYLDVILNCRFLYDIAYYVSSDEEIRNNFLSGSMIESFLMSFVIDDELKMLKYMGIDIDQIEELKNSYGYIEITGLKEKWIRQEQYMLLVDAGMVPSVLNYDDVKKLYNARIDMANDLIMEYKSFFPGYAMVEADIENKNYIFAYDSRLANTSSIAYYLPNAYKDTKKNKFVYEPYIYLPLPSLYPNVIDTTFYHELTHHMNATVLKLSNNLKVQMALEILKTSKRKKESKENIIEVFEKSRYFEHFNEILNDYISSLITKQLHKQNVFLFQTEECKHGENVVHQKLHQFAVPIWEKYKEELVYCFMTGNSEPFMTAIKCDDELLRLINRLWNLAVQLKIEPNSHIKSKIKHNIDKLIEDYNHKPLLKEKREKEKIKIKKRQLCHKNENSK